jgi:hypothetical protein
MPQNLDFAQSEVALYGFVERNLETAFLSQTTPKHPKPRP